MNEYENDPFIINQIGTFRQKESRNSPEKLRESFDLFMKTADINYPLGLYNAAVCLWEGK